MQVDQDRLKSENTNLVAAFREKSRKHQQTQELYDRLKRKEMTAATQSAAYQSVDDVLGSVGGRHGQDQLFGVSQYPNMGRAQGQGQQYQYQGDLNAAAQDYGHGQSNSNGSNGNGKDGAMPPPPRRPAGFRAPGLGSCQSSNCAFHVSDGLLLTIHSAQEMITPSQHRTRLGPLNQPASRPDPSDYRSSSNIMFSSSQNQTPSQRQPFGNISGNSISRPSMSGYGMSAGMKVGRQPGNGMSPILRSMLKGVGVNNAYDSRSSGRCRAE